MQNSLQVLENIISRQGSSQLASSPLKVLASWLAFTYIVILVIRLNAMLSKAFCGLSWIHKTCFVASNVNYAAAPKVLLQTFSQISLAYGLKQLKLFKCLFRIFYICPEQNLEHSYGFPVYHLSHPIDRVLYLLVHHSSLLRLSKGPWDRLFWKKYFFTVSSPLHHWIQIFWHFCFLTLCSVLCINIQ